MEQQPNDSPEAEDPSETTWDSSRWVWRLTLIVLGSGVLWVITFLPTPTYFQEWALGWRCLGGFAYAGMLWRSFLWPKDEEEVDLNQLIDMLVVVVISFCLVLPFIPPSGYATSAVTVSIAAGLWWLNQKR